MCRFPGLKKFFGTKLPNKILKVHVEKIAKTKNKSWLRVTQLESQPQISDHQKRKNVKLIAAASYTLSYAQLESKPQIKNDYYGRATQRANLRHKEDQNAKKS